MVESHFAHMYKLHQEKDAETKSSHAPVIVFKRPNLFPIPHRRYHISSKMADENDSEKNNPYQTVPSRRRLQPLEKPILCDRKNLQQLMNYYGNRPTGTKPYQTMTQPNTSEVCIAVMRLW